MSDRSNSNKGFTLVELAIVLVIIGLLVGGVLQGQELIKQAQIRSIISSLGQFDAAANTFKAKYNQMPGDFARATQFLVDRPNGTGTINVALTADASGDGDNNGFLADGVGGTTATVFGGEIANFWVHLSNTSLIKGGYSQPASFACIVAGTGCTITVGDAYPEMPIGIGTIAVTDGTGGSKLNYILGIPPTVTAAASDLTLFAAGDTLTPDEAYSLDSKLDNGIAISGIVQSTSAYATGGVFTADTSTCNNTTTGVYVVATTTKVCTIRVRASS